MDFSFDVRYEFAGYVNGIPPGCRVRRHADNLKLHRCGCLRCVIKKSLIAGCEKENAYLAPVLRQCV